MNKPLVVVFDKDVPGGILECHRLLRAATRADRHAGHERPALGELRSQDALSRAGDRDVLHRPAERGYIGWISRKARVLRMLRNDTATSVAANEHPGAIFRSKTFDLVPW